MSRNSYRPPPPVDTDKEDTAIPAVAAIDDIDKRASRDQRLREEEAWKTSGHPPYPLGPEQPELKVPPESVEPPKVVDVEPDENKMAKSVALGEWFICINPEAAATNSCPPFVADLRQFGPTEPVTCPTCKGTSIIRQSHRHHPAQLH